MRSGPILASLIIAAAAAGGGYWYWQTRLQPAETTAAPQEAKALAVPVEAVAVAVERLELTIPAVGSLRSSESVTISSEIAGRLSAILVREGEAVTAGTEIARLDRPVHLAAVAEAEASLALSRANFKRAEELWRKKAGSERARDEAEAQFRVDEARLALAQARLEKTVILAPFDGVLGLRAVSAGQYLSPGDPIINIDDIDPLKVDFRVPEVHFSRVRVGQTIALEVDALPGAAISGVVYAIDPQVDEAGRSMVVRAAIPNADGRLRPGLFARVALVYETRDDAMLIPEQALLPIGADTFVFRVVDSKAVLTKVEIGERIGARIEIRGGLAAGDIVVTAGHLKIRDGDEVTVQNPEGV